MHIDLVDEDSITIRIGIALPVDPEMDHGRVVLLLGVDAEGGSDEEGGRQHGEEDALHDLLLVIPERPQDRGRLLVVQVVI